MPRYRVGMSTQIIAGIVVFGLLILTGCLVSYNKFIRQRNLVEESWRQIDVELQRRHNLIPNLIDTVRASAAFEQSTLRQVMNARMAAMRAREDPGVGQRQQGQVEGELSDAMRGFFGLAENYPHLRSSSNFLQLQRQFADTEDRLAAGRRFYNGNVRAYNTRRQSLPSNMVAALFRFGPADFFEVDDPGVRDIPQVGDAFGAVTQRNLPVNDERS